ncbi:MAG: hypothetical protein ACREV6_06115 [Clostridium sp.]|uniref:hypothetical protein n=1 Tax=Clostridium sp. TaxID=1506 RepID=UPI003D6C96A7
MYPKRNLLQADMGYPDTFVVMPFLLHIVDAAKRSNTPSTTGKFSAILLNSSCR